MSAHTSTCPGCRQRLCLHPDTGLCWPCTHGRRTSALRRARSRRMWAGLAAFERWIGERGAA